jgi:hypothetical protein
VVRGIGLVTLVYVNPELNQFWLIDCRFYDPENDNKTKIDHFEDMFTDLIRENFYTFRTVLMDAWYATKRLMKVISSQGKYYCCPVRKNRKVDDSGGQKAYESIEKLE